MKIYLRIVHLSILLFLVSFNAIKSQNSNCLFAKSKPDIFQQDSTYRSKAYQLLEQWRASHHGSDSLTKIGVSKQAIFDDLSYMLDHPNTTLLNDSGYYCGIVVVLNWMLNKRPDLYAKGVLELTFMGETRFVNGSKKIKLPRVLQSKVDYSITTIDGKQQGTDLGNVSLSDFVLGVSLVYAEKWLQKLGLIWSNATHCKTNTGNFLFANTMPWEMNDYFRAIGIREMQKSYYSPFDSKEKTLKRISWAVENGEMPILMENHILTADRTKNIFYKLFGAHFICLHSFQVNPDCNTISMSYWDYGSVKNHREQSEKGSAHSAHSLNQAFRRSKRLNKIKKHGKYLELSTEQFFKGLKGYWIPLTQTSRQ